MTNPSTAGARIDAVDLAPYLAQSHAKTPAVSAAAINVFSPSGIRLRLGVSDDTAALAEQLEFSLGDGPCLQAYRKGRPERAPETKLARRWPLLYSHLTSRTRFRAVTSLPLTNGTCTFGTLDLYFKQARDLAAADLLTVKAAASRTATLLMQTNLTSIINGERLLTTAPVTPRNWVSAATELIRDASAITTAEALTSLRRYALATARTVDAVAQDVATHRLHLARLDPQYAVHLQGHTPKLTG